MTTLKKARFWFTERKDKTVEVQFPLYRQRSTFTDWSTTRIWEIAGEDQMITVTKTTWVHDTVKWTIENKRAIHDAQWDGGLDFLLGVGEHELTKAEFETIYAEALEYLGSIKL